MMSQRLRLFSHLGRACVFALSTLISTADVGHAHALPGSILTFSLHDGQLRLEISFALEDLTIASPTLEVLEDAPLVQNLSPEDLALLTTYLQSHLHLTQASRDLPMTLIHASLETAYHHDLGTFVVVVSHLTAPVPIAIETTPLALSYDVIMHEIRNHRASVYWVQPNEKREGLANFGFRTFDGQPAVHMLTLPSP